MKENLLKSLDESFSSIIDSYKGDAPHCLIVFYKATVNLIKNFEFEEEKPIFDLEDKKMITKALAYYLSEQECNTLAMCKLIEKVKMI